jgi:hypothetical protein
MLIPYAALAVPVTSRQIRNRCLIVWRYTQAICGIPEVLGNRPMSRKESLGVPRQDMLSLCRDDDSFSLGQGSAAVEHYSSPQRTGPRLQLSLSTEHDDAPLQEINGEMPVVSSRPTIWKIC